MIGSDIYNKSFWGKGACNDIGWGIIYKPFSGCESFLLDDYPNIAGNSYSLRNLTSTTTNVIRVRRSSDNAEQDFTATDITDGTLTTFCGLGQDGFVVKWYDQTGSDDLKNATALQQPKIVEGGFVILENGKPCVKFDGGNDSLFVDLTDQTRNGYQAFMVNQQTDTASIFAQYVYTLGDTENNSFRWKGSKLILRGKADLFTPAAANPPQSLYYNISTANGKNSKIHINGTNVATGNISATFTKKVYLGDDGNGSGNSAIKMQEFILYFSNIETVVGDITSNINNYYSIY